MSDEKKGGRFRAFVRNALTWGTAWFSMGLATFAVMRLVGALPEGVSMIDAAGMSIKIGVFGGLVGTVFSRFVRLVYRGKKLADISWIRFGVAAFIVCGLFVPAFLETMNFISGDGFVPLNLVTDDAIVSAFFGGAMAAISLRIAQWSEAREPVTVEQILDRMERESLAPGNVPPYTGGERSPATSYSDRI